MLKHSADIMVTITFRCMAQYNIRDKIFLLGFEKPFPLDIKTWYLADQKCTLQRFDIGRHRLRTEFPSLLAILFMPSGLPLV